MMNRILAPGDRVFCLPVQTNYPSRPTLPIRDTISAKAQFSGRQPSGQTMPRARILCQAVSAPDIPLDRMQLEKLQAALAHGRKRISVKQLCKEVQLDRADVLQWLKHFESAEPSMRASVLGAKKAAIEATEERKSILLGTRPGDRPARQKEPRERLHYKPGFEPHTPGSAPWAANYGRKKLPRSTEATLERIFDESPHPSEAVVKGLFDLHRLPRRRVLDWFAQRRRERGTRNIEEGRDGKAQSENNTDSPRSNS